MEVFRGRVRLRFDREIEDCLWRALNARLGGLELVLEAVGSHWSSLGVALPRLGGCYRKNQEDAHNVA